MTPQDFVEPDTATQNTAVLAHLRSGRTLTALEALRLYGIGRLAARVRDLRDDGHAIEAQMIRVEKANGGHARVASYALAGSDPAAEF